MITTPTPSLLLPAALVNRIRRYSAAAEQMGRLHNEQLQIIFENNWLNLFTPRAAGGLGMDLPGAVRLQESLAWADGSFGWTVTLCSGAHWFIGFLMNCILTVEWQRQVCMQTLTGCGGIFTLPASICSLRLKMNDAYHYLIS